ncbi:exosortase V [Sphingomonas tabacisoli]|uniref:Exosortase V n=1 Tax=Sphingomonas tabacisoli TaxID=2249466 RepID=A0ABW4HYF7_9SPHN
MATRPIRAKAPGSELLARRWPLLLGLAVLALPTLYAVATGSWTGESGVHGPIVLATGIWLFARRWKELLSIQRPGRIGIVLAVLIPSLLLYIFGRAFDFLIFQAAAFLGVCVAVFYGSFGAEAVRRMWFPILYLGFVVPLPGWVITTMTAPMKEYVSSTATWILGHLGYPIVRQGVTIYVAQYELLVEDACAGLNSLISLTAISLFYIYILHNASWRYALFLMLWIVPVALLANLVRVMILVLITYHFGNAAAQGFLHSTAGLVMFATALLGIFLVDGVMSPVRRMLTRSHA